MDATQSMCDEQGTESDLERGKRLYAEAVAKIDRAEIERRRQSKEKGIPLQEAALGHLQMLEAEKERRKSAGEKEFTTQEALADCQVSIHQFVYHG